MSDPAEQAGEIVAEVVTSAIETANEVANDRADIADEIIAGAMETHRGERIRSVEEDVSECLEATAALAQTVETLALQVAGLSGVVSTLQASPPSIVLPPPSEAVDDLPQATEIEIVEPEAVDIQTPAPEPEPPAKARGKRRLWI